MKVKQFLNKLNIGRSSIARVFVKNIHAEECVSLTKQMLIDEDYSNCGNYKVNSFTITEDNITIYCED